LIDLDDVDFPDADTERAVRTAWAWPGTYEDDIARCPADEVFKHREPRGRAAARTGEPT
jgi:hypothetical protein